MSVELFEREFRDPIEWESTLALRPSSPAWRVTIKALYGTPLDAVELELYRTLSGGIDPTPGGSLELLVVAGRRGGKSETIARVGVFEALYGGHGIALAIGQVGLLAVISPLREQSGEIMGYARGLCGLPNVRRYLAGEPGREEIRFTTGISLRIMTADALNVSGPTLVGVIRDEWSKWSGDESAMPDKEIENSLRPALAPVVGAPPRRFIGITSAYIREGLAFETERDCFGKADSDVMVVRGQSTVFNPNLDPKWLEKERRRDARAFRREYLCEWQDAILNGYFAELLDDCVDRGRTENEPREGIEYVIAIDPAWKNDRFALVVVHRERMGKRLGTVVDLVKAWTPPKGGVLSTDTVLAEVAEIARRFGTDIVYTDQAAAPVLIEAARLHDLALVEIPWTGGVGEQSKASKFRRVHNAMANGLIRLTDDANTIRELANISSRLLRGGGEAIEARTGHDDRVAALVLACVKAMDLEGDFGPPPDPDPKPGSAEWKACERERRVKNKIAAIRKRLFDEDLFDDGSDWP